MILIGVVEGSKSHFLYIGLSCFSMLSRKNIIFYNILHFTSEDNNKSVNQNSDSKLRNCCLKNKSEKNDCLHSSSYIFVVICHTII